DVDLSFNAHVGGDGVHYVGVAYERFPCDVRCHRAACGKHNQCVCDIVGVNPSAPGVTEQCDGFAGFEFADHGGDELVRGLVFTEHVRGASCGDWDPVTGGGGVEDGVLCGLRCGVSVGGFRGFLPAVWSTGAEHFRGSDVHNQG